MNEFKRGRRNPHALGLDCMGARGGYDATKVLDALYKRYEPLVDDEHYYPNAQPEDLNNVDLILAVGDLLQGAWLQLRATQMPTVTDAST
jgi:hypothetical protein